VARAGPAENSAPEGAPAQGTGTERALAGRWAHVPEPVLSRGSLRAPRGTPQRRPQPKAGLRGDSRSDPSNGDVASRLGTRSMLGSDGRSEAALPDGGINQAVRTSGQRCSRCRVPCLPGAPELLPELCLASRFGVGSRLGRCLGESLGNFMEEKRPALADLAPLHLSGECTAASTLREPDHPPTTTTKTRWEGGRVHSRWTGCNLERCSGARKQQQEGKGTGGGWGMAGKRMKVREQRRAGGRESREGRRNLVVASAGWG